MPMLALARAIGAYVLWGLFPLYFQFVTDVSSGEVLAHRIVWALVFLVLILLVTRQVGAFQTLLKDRRQMLWLSVGALMVSINWLSYIYAISSNQALAASLGYFINPLINIMLAMLFLHERMTRNQLFALLLACVGIGIQIVEVGALPWISLSLAISWGFYNLIKKKLQASALTTLSAETLVLAPFALAYVLWLSTQDNLSFGSNAYYTWLLPIAGLITALPLLLFGAAAKHTNLITLSFIQYLTPTMIFLIALFWFNEPLSQSRLMTFVCIWAGLIFFSLDALNAKKESRA